MEETLKIRASRALHIAARGTMGQVEDFESATGCALSTSLDGLWDEAEDAGALDLAQRLGRAHERLTT